MAGSVFPALACPLPIATNTHVVLGHGSGGRLSAELMRDIFLPAFGNAALDRLDDQAILEMGSGRIAFSTDSFVVKPLFFPRRKYRRTRRLRDDQRSCGWRCGAEIS